MKYDNWGNKAYDLRLLLEELAKIALVIGAISAGFLIWIFICRVALMAIMS